MPIIAADSHIRLAAPETNEGVAMLRRGYSFTDGIDATTGELDAGLFFIAFQQDPRTAFIPIQRRLSAQDSLMEYLRHTGSGLYAVPPGINGAGGYLGQALFEG